MILNLKKGIEEQANKCKTEQNDSVVLLLALSVKENVVSIVSVYKVSSCNPGIDRSEDYTKLRTRKQD